MPVASPTGAKVEMERMRGQDVDRFPEELIGLDDRLEVGCERTRSQG